MSDLIVRKCKPCAGGVEPLKLSEAQILFGQLSGWVLGDGMIIKTYSFKTHY